MFSNEKPQSGLQHNCGSPEVNPWLPRGVGNAPALSLHSPSKPAALQGSLLTARCSADLFPPSPRLRFSPMTAGCLSLLIACCWAWQAQISRDLESPCLLPCEACTGLYKMPRAQPMSSPRKRTYETPIRRREETMVM